MFNIFSRSQKNEREKKQSRFSTLLSYQNIGQPVWTDTQFDMLSKEGYQKNVIVYRCVNLIAKSLSSVSLALYEDEYRKESDPLLSLLNQPNPFQGHNAFFESLISFLLLAGNAYVEVVTSSQESSIPEELYVLRPDRMKIIAGARGFPSGYEYSTGLEKRHVSIDPLTGFSPILHMRFFHPTNDWYGMSPLEAARQSIDLHNTVMGHNLALLQNEGRPSGALIVRNQHGLTELQRQQLREDLEGMYSGKNNAGRMMILEGDFEWKEMGFSPKDLDFIEGKNLSSREISQAFGVPPMLVGVLGDATFSNYREARMHLWEDTIIPLLEAVLNQLNRWLVPLFGPNLRLTYDQDKIPALAPKRESVWERINNAEFLTFNEKRKAIGYPPIEGGDRLSPNDLKKEQMLGRNIKEKRESV